MRGGGECKMLSGPSPLDEVPKQRSHGLRIARLPERVSIQDPRGPVGEQSPLLDDGSGECAD